MDCLYVYPKTETPGCTQQAKVFRDSVDAIHALKTEIFGVSSDDVPTIAKFHSKELLNFTLLADPELKIIKAYGSKMLIFSRPKRWTYIIDPNLKIADAFTNVEPALDAANVIKELKRPQGK